MLSFKNVACDCVLYAVADAMIGKTAVVPMLNKLGVQSTVFMQRKV